MIQEDPSDKFLKENLRLITDTPERSYLMDEANSLLVASWKAGKANVYDEDRYRSNAMTLADLIKTRRPEYIMVDCRHLGFELTYQDHIWYVNQTRAIWEKAKVKKMAFIFKDNLSVQVSMEGLREAAQEEGIKNFEHRIFESVVDAAGWLKGSK